MDLRHLRYFLAVVDAGHVGRAAERLRVSQPALSQQLRDLEGEIGGPLFERHSKGMTPTTAGQALVGPARIALAAAATALAEARTAAGHAAERLVVGLPETGAAFDVVRRALSLYPPRDGAALIQTSGLAWLEQPRALLSGAIDVGFCWSPGGAAPVDKAYPAGIEALRLYEDPGSDALVPAGHPLASLTVLTPEDLGAMPLGLYDRSLHPSLHDAITAEARRAGFSAVMLAEGVGSASASAPLVLALSGWTLVQRSVAVQPPAGTRAIPVRGLKVDAGLDVIIRTGDGRRSVTDLVNVIAKAFGHPGTP